MFYFDTAASTPVDSRVADLVARVQESVFGNPSSIHRYGQEAWSYVEQARRQIASAVNCKPTEIIFTSSGTEANNMMLWNHLHSDKKHLVISAVEHPSITNTVANLKKFGITSYVVSVDSTGLVDTDDVRQAIQKDTGLVAVMMANNETGTIQPVREIAAICGDAGTALHCDGVQALGKIPIDFCDLPVTSMSFSAHKVYGPKGVGALFLREGSLLAPFISGGHQEQGYRAGTENVAGIAGFGLAVELAVKELPSETQRLNGLREFLLSELSSVFPEMKVNGHPHHRVPGIVNISLPDVPADALLRSLDLEGIALSSGSACSSGTPKPSPVLKAMGVPDFLNRRSLRISFGRFTTKSEIKTLIWAMKKHGTRLAGENSVSRFPTPAEVPL